MMFLKLLEIFAEAPKGFMGFLKTCRQLVISQKLPGILKNIEYYEEILENLEESLKTLRGRSNIDMNCGNDCTCSM